MTEIAVPYTFIPGTKAKAEEVNANFNALQEAIGMKADKAGDVNQPLSVADATENSHAVNKGQLDKAKTDLMRSANLNRTNFCVKSGNLTNGVPDLFECSLMVVNAKVGGSFPKLVIGHLDGKTVTRNELNTIDMTGKSDGTYNIFIPDEGDAYVLKNTIYRQVTKPTMLENDVWLDLSCENLNAKKYNGSALVDFNDVPLGKVVVKDAAVTSVETLEYNQNGYNVNLLTNDWRKSMPDYTRGVGKSWGTNHTATSDGWLYFSGSLQGPALSVYVYINGIKFEQTISGDGGSWGKVASGIYPIVKGNTYSTFNTVSSGTLIFYPCIGVN